MFSSYRKYVLLQILLLNVVEFVTSFPTNDAFQKRFLELVELNLRELPLPLTIRLVDFGSNQIDDGVAELVRAIPPKFSFLVGNTKPMRDSPDNRSITTGGVTGKIELFNYLVIMWVSNLENVPQAHNTVQLSINRRKDRTIFIVENRDILDKLAAIREIQGLRDKYLLDVTNPDEVWTDPAVFNEGKLSAFSLSQEFPVRKRMGGILAGRRLKSAQSEIFHWAYVESKDALGNVEFSGSFYNLQVEAMKRFNYTLDVDLLETYAAFENGTWTGTTGCVLNGPCDLSLCLSPEYIWGYGMDFAPYVSTAQLIFWTNYPRSDPKWYGFLMPLSPTVWICVLLSSFLFGAVVFLTMYWKEGQKVNDVVWSTGVILPFALALEQGVSTVPGTVRNLALIWLLATLVIGTGYKSTLRNNLMFPPEDRIPLTHAALADRTDYVATLYSFGELELEHFRSSTDPKIQRIYKRLKLEKDRIECLENVLLNYKQTCSAWHPPSAMLIAKFLTVHLLFTPLVHSKDNIALSYMTLAFPKDSILVDTFSLIVSAVREGGIYDKLAADETYKLKKSGVLHWQNSSEAEKSSEIFRILENQVKNLKNDEDSKPLSLGSLWVVLLFIPVGCLISFVAFIWEKRHYSLSQTLVLLVSSNGPVCI